MKLLRFLFCLLFFISFTINFLPFLPSYAEDDPNAQCNDFCKTHDPPYPKGGSLAPDGDIEKCDKATEIGIDICCCKK